MLQLDFAMSCALIQKDGKRFSLTVLSLPAAMLYGCDRSVKDRNDFCEKKTADQPFDSLTH